MASYTSISEGIGDSRTTSAASNRSMAVKVFSGEVLTAFEEKNIFLPLVQSRTIQNGKSASFAVIGKYDQPVTTHVPGSDVVPNLINAGERVIEIGQLQYASVFVDNFEEAMLHYDTRSQYSTEMGNRLAKTVDEAVISQLDLAITNAGNADDTKGGEGQPWGASQDWVASTTVFVKGGFATKSGIVYKALADHPAAATIAADVTAGNMVAVSKMTIDTATPTTSGTKGDAVLASLFDAQTFMDESDIPGERFVVVSPKNYNRLVQSGAVHKDMTQGGNGGIDTGKVVQVAGHNILVSNNIGTSDVYMFTKHAVGVVKLLDIKSEVNYIPEKLGDLMTSSYAMGFGTLNNACVIKLSSND